jgi:CrcB protein
MQRPYLLQMAIVGLGGFFGSALRFAVSGLAHRMLPSTAFPVGTLTVNVLGCLAIGLLAGLAEVRQMLGPEARLFLLFGVLGGFTTFSTFAYETFVLAQGSDHLRAAGNLVAQVVLGLAAAWVGYELARHL